VFAIQAKNVGVKFILRHQKTDTLLETLIHLLRWQNQSRRSLSIGSKETFWPIRNISFSVEEGESLGIIGRNGAGKSTLLQILAGIYRPDEGTLKKNGTAGLLQIGTGFHNDLTGRENIYLSGAFQGLNKKKISRLYDSIVEFSEIEHFINTPIKHYSTGMRARLGFSIAIRTKPNILLIDEVLAVGDEAFKSKCLVELEKIRAEGITIVFVSHSMNQIKRICDRAICLNEGQIVFEGTSSDAAHFYNELTTASLMQNVPKDRNSNLNSLFI
jgi:ABC-type polysaccharide/polyol phosphate transport system ATPase subunit